jgi:hypothetical protein
MLSGDEDPDAARGRFLDGLRRGLPGARMLTLRDWMVGEPPRPAAMDRHLTSVSVPTADPRRVASLDAVPVDGRLFDD